MQKFLCLLFFALIGPAIAAQQAVNNSSVIKMVKAGLSEDIIVATINSSPGSYDTSPDGLIAMKKAGVSDRVISVILAKSTGAAAPAPAAAAPVAAAPAPQPSGPPPGVNAIGVYYKGSGGSWQQIPGEIVDFKSTTTGLMKHIASAGLAKGEAYGQVAGRTSHLPLKTPASFILYVPDGRSAEDYQLVRLNVNNDGREFRSAASGPSRDAVEFTSKEIAPRAYEVDLSTNILGGEYGFLAPPDASAGKNAAGPSRIYAFSIE